MAALPAVFVHRLLEVFLRSILVESRSVGVKRDHLATLIHQNEQVETGDPPHIP